MNHSTFTTSAQERRARRARKTMTASDMSFAYSWRSLESKESTSLSDRAILVRNSGYDVLALINRIAEILDVESRENLVRIEHLIRASPSQKATVREVQKWVMAHWSAGTASTAGASIARPLDHIFAHYGPNDLRALPKSSSKSVRSP